MSGTSSSIAQKLQALKADLPEGTTLVAVSKTKPLEDLQAAYAAGQRHFGENRIQEMAEKHEQLPKDIQWHMIGHVQGNKIKYMAPFVYMVHGIDKAKRLKELNKEAAKNQRHIHCLLQIHIAEEETKFGFDFDEAEAVLRDQPSQKYPQLQICGLMGMATFTDESAKVKREFSRLAQFFQKVKESSYCPANFDTLSMGMTGDYKLAVEEGSTMLRIGSAIFGARQ